MLPFKLEFLTECFAKEATRNIDFAMIENRYRVHFSAFAAFYGNAVFRDDDVTVADSAERGFFSLIIPNQFSSRCLCRIDCVSSRFFSASTGLLHPANVAESIEAHSARASMLVFIFENSTVL